MKDARERQVEAWLEGVTYKPGSSFLALELEDGSCLVQVTSQPIDVYDHSRNVYVFMHNFVPDSIVTREEFDEFLLHLVTAHENHETHEWLRRNGKCIREPSHY